MKTLVLLICVVGAGLAQTTRVTGSIRDPAGDLVAGSCAFQAAAQFTAASGWRVIGAPMTVPFTAGALSVALAPTDTATPSGQYYKMTCAVPKQTLAVGSVGPYSFGPTYLLVPTSSTALDIGTLEVSSAPATPSFVVQWAQMAPLSGALAGQAAVWSGTSWQAGYALFNGNLTWAQIEAGSSGAPSTGPTTSAIGNSFYKPQAGATAYVTVPFACSVTAWDVALDTGTASVDVWRAAAGTSVPTSSAQSITGTAMPSIATGTEIHSTLLTGWSTVINVDDVLGFNVHAVTGAPNSLNVILECQR